MLVNEDVIEKVLPLFLDLAMQTALNAHKYIEEHNNINGYNKYPVSAQIFSREETQYADLFESVPMLFYDIPKYRMGDFPKDSIQYSEIFNVYSKDFLDCTLLTEFNCLIEYISSEPPLKKLLSEKEDVESLKFRIKTINNEIVTRYLFRTSATSTVPNDLREQLKPFVSEKILRFIAKNLRISILIPICLITFDEDKIVLSDNVEILRIPDAVQKSRQQACTYDSNNEDWAAACATHMIVLNNYHFENNGDLSINEATRNYDAYPLKIIDTIIGAIRIVTGYTLGYAQILTLPIDWIAGFCADLIPLYGAKSHFINPKETKKLWMHLPISKVTEEQTKALQKVYKNILQCEADDKKSNFLFALNRFNRCMLRNDEDDMATDATIGLEALLAGGTKGEITYTLSNRIPVIFAYKKNERYTSSNCRSIMKSIYNYRSKIVHGGKLKPKDKCVEINGEKIDISKVAVDFLRYTLLFMTEHQELLDAKKIDECIDDMVSKAENQLQDIIVQSS